MLNYVIRHFLQKYQKAVQIVMATRRSPLLMLTLCDASFMRTTHRYSIMDLDDAKLVHLYNLAHYKCLNPILACHAVDADIAIAKAEINVPTIRSHCDNCGTFLLPGLTSSTRIKYTKGKSGRSRELRTTCLVCSHVRVNDCLINAKRREVTPQNQSTGVPKKKKKKKSNLSSLLEQKRQESNSPLLFDFM